jgi:hypothetical protein
MTWDYNTDSLQPNHSKGDIVFMGVFANVYIGNKAFLFSNSAATVFTLQGLHLLVKKL